VETFRKEGLKGLRDFLQIASVMTFEQSLGQLLDVQRNTFRPIRNAVAHTFAQAIAGDGAYELAAFAAAQLIQPKLSGVTLAAPILRERLPASGENHDGQVFDAFQYTDKQSDRCRVAPMGIFDDRKDWPCTSGLHKEPTQ